MAFLVGGCVRDLLIGLEPKDFDVATDALPEQVKRLFRNCRLVGRRFRLAHVFFGREIIEVATFRAASAPDQGEEPLPDADPEDGEAAELDDPQLEAEVLATPPDDDSDDTNDGGSRAAIRRGFSTSDPETDTDVLNSERMFDETGRILRDNVYGTIDADVWRRDFTANSLYYNIADFSVWDSCGGVEDVRAHMLKPHFLAIPDALPQRGPGAHAARRALRRRSWDSSLGSGHGAEPIDRLGDLLGGVPPARLFDETLKLFLGGHGARSFEVLRRRGLLAALLPTVDAYLTAHPGSLVEKLLIQGLKNTDSRVQADKPVTPTFLFALLLYGPIAGIIEAMPPERWHELGTILDACDLAARQAQTSIAIPKRFSLGVREMFGLQPRLEHPRGRRALRILEHPRFRAAYDLLLLRAQFGLAPTEMAQWWTRIQEVSPEERAQMAESLTGQSPRSEGPARGHNGGGGGRRRRRRRRPAGPS